MDPRINYFPVYMDPSPKRSYARPQKASTNLIGQKLYQAFIFHEHNTMKLENTCRKKNEKRTNATEKYAIKKQCVNEDIKEEI